MEKVRIDKWLWAARFFRTRALAADAVDGGKVHVNDSRVKPAKGVGIGDTIRMTQEPSDKIVVVRGLGEKRGPAAAAMSLYEETEESRTEREKAAAARRERAERRAPRPSKKDRRDLRRLRERW